MTQMGVNELTNIHIGPQIDCEDVGKIYTKNQILCCKTHEKVIIKFRIEIQELRQAFFGRVYLI